jgi:hypothetical protein
MPARAGIFRFNVPRNECGNAETYLAPAHFWKANHPVAPIHFIAVMAVALTDFRNGSAQVTVPFHRVHREVKMGVKNQHGTIGMVLKHGGAGQILQSSEWKEALLFTFIE